MKIIYKLLHKSAKWTNKKIECVNQEDIQENFWGKYYLILLTRVGFPFLVNAEYEQHAIDILIDYLAESGENEGLMERDYDRIEEHWLSGGNYGYGLSADNYRIIEL